MYLYNYQQEALNRTKDQERVAYFLAMGLGKTFVAGEKLKQLNNNINLVICQKTKIDDWVEHLNIYYNDSYNIYNLRKDSHNFLLDKRKKIGVINYDMLARSDYLKELKDILIVLDESAYIKNPTAKRTKAVFRLSINQCILLSGTPVNGKYEELYTQLKLIGYAPSKDYFIKRYCLYYVNNTNGFPLKIIYDYKNIDELKQVMYNLGCVLMTAEDAKLELPEENIINISINNTKIYKDFTKNDIAELNGKKLLGDNVFKKILYRRKLCNNCYKLEKLQDLLNATGDRVIIFYNFNDELDEIKKAIKDRPLSIVNGTKCNLDNFNNHSNAVTVIQYQAGSMGLNLQKANIIIFYSLCLSSSIYEQSKARIRRLGQDKACFYYNLIVKNSIEEKIYEQLKIKKDYTEVLFKNE